MFIDGGRIPGFAPQETLIEVNPQYAKMYEAQAKHYREAEKEESVNV